MATCTCGFQSGDVEEMVTHISDSNRALPPWHPGDPEPELHDVEQ